jgi:hypothetical protein
MALKVHFWALYYLVNKLAPQPFFMATLTLMTQRAAIKKCDIVAMLSVVKLSVITLSDAAPRHHLKNIFLSSFDDTQTYDTQGNN